MRRRAGFTMLELMSVITMIGVLAAVAIPNFIRVQLESKSAEGVMLVHTIAHRIHVAEEEGRRVADCGPTPAEVPGTTKALFPDEPCWRALGFSPQYPVYFQLQLDVQKDGGWLVTATADLDGDDHVQIIRLADSDLRARRTRGVY